LKKKLKKKKKLKGDVQGWRAMVSKVKVKGGELK